MSNAILGISAFYHDSAAALLVDGDTISSSSGRTIYKNKARFIFSDKCRAVCAYGRRRQYRRPACHRIL